MSAVVYLEPLGREVVTNQEVMLTQPCATICKLDYDQWSVALSLLQMACSTVDGSSCVSGPWAWSEIRGITPWFVNCVPMIDEGRSVSNTEYRG